jgi:hypothetical protein
MPLKLLRKMAEVHRQVKRRHLMSRGVRPKAFVSMPDRRSAYDGIGVHHNHDWTTLLLNNAAFVGTFEAFVVVDPLRPCNFD